MNPLFAPWRMEVIEAYSKQKTCFLCDLVEEKGNPNEQVIYRGEKAFVIMNKYPYSNGHIMVVPKRHEGDWTNLSREEILEIAELTQKGLKVLTQALKAQGFNVGANLGKIAGAGMESHVHQHIVPRWQGDYNFMPVIAEVKIISEHLQVTYEKIKKAWEASA